MKKTVALLLALALVFSLCACGGRKASDGNAYVSGGDAWYASDGDAWYASDGDAWYASDGDAWYASDGDAWYASDGNALFATPGDAAVNPGRIFNASADDPAFGPDRIVFKLEYERLYTMPAGGGVPALLRDASVCGWDRFGDTVVAAFEDRSVYSFDLLTGEETLLWADPPQNIYQLNVWDDGFVFSFPSMQTGPEYGIFTFSDHQVKMLPQPVNGYRTQPCIADGRLILQEYSEDDCFIVCFDLPSLTERWRMESDFASDLWESGNNVYITMRDFPDSEILSVYRIQSEDAGLSPTALKLYFGNETLKYTDGDHAIVEGGYWDDYTTYYLSGEERLILPRSSPYSFTYAADSRNGKVLLSSGDSWESSYMENHYVQHSSFYLLDIATGDVTPLELRGVNESLFSAGDFPVLDTSTARKPVTAELYSFFCEGPGIPGNQPLCSTTHYAWLNIADRKADLALLAAPTEEEQDYLRQQGVEVEMKLYGGDGLVFIGSKECGVENLTLEQLRQIFRGRITNWRELGGADHPIRVLYRDDQSGSQRLFEKLLWKDEEVPDLAGLGFERLDEMSTIVWECLDDPYAIGYSIMTYLQDVYDEESLLTFSLEGVAPAAENVANGSYPLSTQGYVVIRSDEAPDSPARRLYDWFGSPTCDTLLRQNSITPLHG